MEGRGGPGEGAGRGQPLCVGYRRRARSRFIEGRRFEGGRRVKGSKGPDFCVPVPHLDAVDSHARTTSPPPGPLSGPLYGGAAFISPCPCAIAVDGVRGQARVVGGSCNLSIFFFCFGGNGRFNALRSSERGGKQLDYGGVAIDGGNRKGGEASVGQQAGISAA